MESLAGLKPAFDKDGTITAANASQISDGGSALVLMSEKARQCHRGITPLGQFVSYGMVAGPDSVSLLQQPSRAINKALEQAPARPISRPLDLFEINEAFAAVEHRFDGGPRRSATRSSTSTAGRSPSGTRSA